MNAALMPDYNRRAAVFWWLAVTAGAGLLGACLLWLLRQPGLVQVQVLAAFLLAVGSGLFPIRLPGTINSFAVGEVFIFLVLLVLGWQAAVLVAAGEVAVGAWRTSKRWTSRLFSPAIGAVSMACCGAALQWALKGSAEGASPGAAALLATMLAFALGYFVVNATLLSAVQRLKRRDSVLNLRALFGDYRWIGLAYAGSASVATLLFITWREQGVGVLLVLLPVLALLLVTLHLFFRQQEAGLALQKASADAAAREAAAAQREALAAARHLEELAASERRFHSAFVHAGIGMALLGFDGRILQANPALALLLGRSEADLQASLFQALVEAADRAPLEQHLGLSTGRDFEAFACEVRCLQPDGNPVWLALNCSFFTEPEVAAEAEVDRHAVDAPAPATPGAGRPCLILQAQDVSARRRAEAGLQHLAFHDPLTGLPNRRRFQECLVSALARSQADPRHPWAVMFIDFDRFKLVNDSLGHQAGDELLQQVARRVQEKLRPSDIVARLGGDEFAILATDMEHERDAVQLAERLMEALRQPFQLGDVELIASASIGITFSAIGYSSADAVLRDADIAMYKAKAGGKARYELFDTSLHTAVSGRLRLEGELRNAIAQGQLVVVYQPLFEINPAGGAAPAGRLTGFEALLRWQHPQSGMLAPAEFLSVAEESGQMLGLSDFVLHCACQQLRQWQLSDPRLAGLTMAINLSANDLAHPGLVARVSRAIVEAGLRPEHLTLELTESILMSQIEGVLPSLAALRELGVRLAVDDFGTGYSSLSHLSRLPIDSLKIDRSFVSQLQPGSDDAAVVNAIIQLGGTLRKVVVAEGIESAQQMEQLRAMGCAYGQGFHLAHPLGGGETGEWLRAQRSQLH